MSGFYTSSPWSGGASAADEIGSSLRRLTMAMAQKNAMQRFQQQRMALMQQQAQMRGGLEQAQAGHAEAQTGYENARTKHQGLVDQAAQDYQKGAVAQSEGPDFMMNGPTIADAGKMDLARLMGERALVRGLGGNVDNPPSGTVNPGQERINTLNGDVMGYLPPNPSFHSVPAGGTPYVMGGDGQAQQQGPQSGFRPSPVQGMRPSDIRGMAGTMGGIMGSQYAPPESVKMAQEVFPMLVQAFTNQMQLPIKAVDTSPGNASQSKKPTRQQAADLVTKLGSKEAAMKQLQQSGFDTSGYAD